MLWVEKKKLVKSSKYAKFALVNNFFVVIDIFSSHVWVWHSSLVMDRLPKIQASRIRQIFGIFDNFSKFCYVFKTLKAFKTRKNGLEYPIPH